MDSITLQNYRCFGSEKQTARLAPLTLLVGPNSTGKTSFLALIRALWDAAFRGVAPDFREAPYDLGSFQDIVHQRGGRGKQATQFEAGFEFMPPTSRHKWAVQFNATFENRYAAPFPVVQRFDGDSASIEMHVEEGGLHAIYLHEAQSDGFTPPPINIFIPGPFGGMLSSLMFSGFLREAMHEGRKEDGDIPIAGLRNAIARYRFSSQPFASAPIRSRPLRTYDPVRPSQDPEGEYIPSYLASLSRRSPDEWQRLKKSLEKFGHDSGLFDDIAVKSFGKTGGDPFQIQVRKHGKGRKGPWRNLIDVGYGVSQALPVLTELLSDNPPPMFLLQQPEVHLHPSAQAALGSLLCSVAGNDRQLIIETHSDYIIDRLRMDVRDGTTGLKPEDVSILYFEPGDVSVKIHSIRLDEMGNVLDAPPGYRQFFTDEMMRSIGL